MRPKRMPTRARRGMPRAPPATVLGRTCTGLGAPRPEHRTLPRRTPTGRKRYSLGTMRSKTTPLRQVRAPAASWVTLRSSCGQTRSRSAVEWPLRAATSLEEASTTTPLSAATPPWATSTVRKRKRSRSSSRAAAAHARPRALPAQRLRRRRHPHRQGRHRHPHQGRRQHPFQLRFRSVLIRSR